MDLAFPAPLFHMHCTAPGSIMSEAIVREDSRTTSKLRIAVENQICTNAHYNLLHSEDECQNLDYSPCISPSGKMDSTKYIWNRKGDEVSKALRISMTAEAAAAAKGAEVAAMATEAIFEADVG